MNVSEVPIFPSPKFVSVSGEEYELKASVIANYIDDYADKSYRSFMLSMPKGGMSLAKIKNFVDICFIFKVNHLHLHLSDNTYYCFPSKVLPDLPSPEAVFSFEEIEELNTYANERGIIIVPEIDLPGHAATLTARCPDIFANQYEGGASNVMYSEAGRSSGCRIQNH